MISGPRNSRPTLRGWVNKTTGQLVKAEVLTKAQIDAWDAAQNGEGSIPVADPLGLIESDPLGLEKIEEELDLPDDLGLSDFDESQMKIMNDYVQARRKAGEAQLEYMRRTGQMDYYKDLLSKTLRKK